METLTYGAGTMNIKRSDTGTARLCLQDEAPRIGSGWRTVRYKIGNRWVRIQCLASGREQRLKRRLFQEIVEGSERRELA
jgi:hypothetical protein